MAVYTFSTKDTKPIDAQTVEEVKAYCETHGISFSYLVLTLLKKWHEENKWKPSKKA